MKEETGEVGGEGMERKERQRRGRIGEEGVKEGTGEGGRRLERMEGYKRENRGRGSEGRTWR